MWGERSLEELTYLLVLPKSRAQGGSRRRGTSFYCPVSTSRTLGLLWPLNYRTDSPSSGGTTSYPGWCQFSRASVWIFSLLALVFLLLLWKIGRKSLLSSTASDLLNSAEGKVDNAIFLGCPWSSPSEKCVCVPNPYIGFHPGHSKSRRTRIRNAGSAAT